MFLAAAALVGAASLSSCATFSNHGVAAKVDNTTLSQHDLEVLTTTYLANEIAGATSSSPLPTAQLQRNLLTIWVLTTGLSTAGAVSQAEIDAAMSSGPATHKNSWVSAPPEVQKMVAIWDAIQGAQLSITDGTAAMSKFKVSVDSRNGWWDSANLAVTAFG
jgi:hypothetical protein